MANNTEENKSFQIQLMSDIHLEFGTEPQFEAKSPILVLAGDIGNPMYELNL